MQFPILQYLDVVIGLAVVMIVVATFVAAVTQLIVSVTYARARYLRDGLSALLAEIDPAKLGSHARYLAELVVRDEAVASKKLFPWLTKFRNNLRGSSKALPAFSPAKVIQREELILLLLKLASQAATKPAFAPLLGALNVTSPSAAETLLDIQREIVNQEAAQPKAPAAAWRNAAIQTVARKTDELRDFVAKVYAWYDNTVDRVIANFALEAKAVTAVVAFFVCAWLQLDTIGLVKRLSTDENYRKAVVSRAEKLEAVSKEPSRQAPKKEDEAREEVAKRLAEVKDLDLLPVELGFNTGKTVFGLPWVKPNENAKWPWPGLLLSWVLVSLGAPFWYDVLKNAMGLRSALAKKDDEDRKARREQQT